MAREREEVWGSGTSGPASRPSASWLGFVKGRGQAAATLLELAPGGSGGQWAPWAPPVTPRWPFPLQFLGRSPRLLPPPTLGAWGLVFISRHRILHTGWTNE